MKYLNEIDFSIISETIQDHLSHREPSLNYASYEKGFQEWKGVMERIKMKHYYPSFFDKATYLLIGLNKGHFYPNGNKRLALVTVVLFIQDNEFKIHTYYKKKYKKYLMESFPNFDDFKDYSDFTRVAFVFYNLSIIIADSSKIGLSYEELKKKVNDFLKFALYK